MVSPEWLSQAPESFHPRIKLTQPFKSPIRCSSIKFPIVGDPGVTKVENELLVQTYRDVTVVSFQNISVLDSANIEALGRNLLDLVEKQDTRKLVLEFTAVRFMSSQALGVLLQLKRAMDPLKGQVIIAGIRPELHKVFKITNLHKLFVFHDTLDKALGEFNVFIPKN
jgi:anti-anti-sigma factor